MSSRPVMRGKDIEELAKEMGSPAVMKIAEEVYRDELKAMNEFIGHMTIKKEDGVFYQKRPHGWMQVGSLSDLLFDDVLPINVSKNVRSCWAIRIQISKERTYRHTVSVPARTDITVKEHHRLIVERLAVAYDVDVIDVIFKVAKGLVGYRAYDKTDIGTLLDIPQDLEVGGSMLTLEV